MKKQNIVQNCCYVILKHVVELWFWFNFIGRLKVMNTWSWLRNFESCYLLLATWNASCFNLIFILSTLAHVCDIWNLRPFMFVFNILNSIGWHIGWITLACYIKKKIKKNSSWVFHRVIEPLASLSNECSFQNVRILVWLIKWLA